METSGLELCLRVVKTQQNTCFPCGWFLHRYTRDALAFSRVGVYHPGNVGQAYLSAMAALALCACSAGAQIIGSSSSQPINVRGQVYAPQGGQLQQSIRVELKSDDASRPPDFVFTDGSGRFFLHNLFPGRSYTVTVESDGKNWATTSVRFIPSGFRPTVQIDLNPLEKQVAEGGARVSVAELKQDVPADARKEFEAALELMAQGESARARPLLARAIELYPDFVSARNELAVALLKEGDLAGAEAQLRRALETDATAVRPLLNLGLCLYRQQRYPDALPFLDKAVQLDPNLSGAQLLLGITLVMAGNDHRAEATLKRAYAQGGRRNARAQFYLARLYTRRKDYSRAALALETYLREVPDDPNASELRETLERLRSGNPQP